MVMANSAPVAASRGVAAAVAPTSVSALDRERFQARTRCPAAIRFMAIGMPIAPRPRNATVVVM
jgi:hypothetical protein